MKSSPGMQYMNKSFSVAMGGSTVERTPEEEAEAKALKDVREAEAAKVKKATQEHLNRIASQKVTRKLIPYGTRILVKRRKVEDKSSHIILPDEVKNLPTDIADVVEVPEQTFVDKEILKNAEKMILSLSQMAQDGDAKSVQALLALKDYLQIMTIQKGDVLLMARYGGTDFLIQETKQTLCVTDANGVYALIKETKQ